VIRELQEITFGLAPVGRSAEEVYRCTFERMQERSDGECTSMKIYAWRFTRYDGILFLDSDVCPLAPLAPFLARACDAGHAFLSMNEKRQGVSRGAAFREKCHRGSRPSARGEERCPLGCASRHALGTSASIRT